MTVTCRDRICTQCGGPVDGGKRGHSKYCSDACRQAAYRTRKRNEILTRIYGGTDSVTIRVLKGHVLELVGEEGGFQRWRVCVSPIDNPSGDDIPTVSYWIDLPLRIAVDGNGPGGGRLHWSQTKGRYRHESVTQNTGLTKSQVQEQRGPD